MHAYWGLKDRWMNELSRQDWFKEEMNLFSHQDWEVSGVARAITSPFELPRLSWWPRFKLCVLHDSLHSRPPNSRSKPLFILTLASLTLLSLFLLNLWLIHYSFTNPHLWNLDSKEWLFRSHHEERKGLRLRMYMMISSETSMKPLDSWHRSF